MQITIKSLLFPTTFLELLQSTICESKNHLDIRNFLFAKYINLCIIITFYCFYIFATKYLFFENILIRQEKFLKNFRHS